ncbi:hypothetical protein GCM10010269_75390 [Streptomyces humidus]|uniref:DUF3099 domain-containing protein n=1 Tax=Streptomyces humidus TaxID=52259 RepID=A0A918LAL8_9ACTN|nr:hypothetical protein GCM10010269_75390 [Streptomyces humidus]
MFRITGARQGLQDDVRGRQRRYVISMSVRTVAVVLAATLWNVERYVAVVALVLGLVLPYIAVVIANAGRENVPSLPSTFLTSPVRPMVTRSRDDDEPSGSAPQAESHPQEEGAPGAVREESAPGSAERRR